MLQASSGWGAETPIFSEEFVENDPGGGGDVQRGFRSEHWNAHVGCGEVEQFGAEAFDFVAKGDADGKLWLPVEQVDGLRRGLDGGEFESAGAHLLRHANWVPVVLPGDGFLGT